jgi:uncharacterized protein (DUF433 family)
MSLLLHPDPIPLRRDETGAIRVGQTRVLLELLIEAFQQGASPETIVQWFENLRLADVYAVISFYLNHQAEVEEYLRQREAMAAEVRRKIEASQPNRPGYFKELQERQAR